MKSLLTLTLHHFLPILLCPYGKAPNPKAFPSATRIFRQFSVTFRYIRHPALRGCAMATPLIEPESAMSLTRRRFLKYAAASASLAALALPTASAATARGAGPPSPLDGPC